MSDAVVIVPGGSSGIGQERARVKELWDAGIARGEELQAAALKL
jgi:NADP-dependent 3-hydroxy acid dehydrogenase YdfG